MTVTTEKTVRELALENPGATRVFEKLGIDYCCGGDKSLEQACREANLAMDQVLICWQRPNLQSERQTGRDWQDSFSV